MEHRAVTVPPRVRQFAAELFQGIALDLWSLVGNTGFYTADVVIRAAGGAGIRQLSRHIFNTPVYEQQIMFDELAAQKPEAVAAVVREIMDDMDLAERVSSELYPKIQDDLVRFG